MGPLGDIRVAAFADAPLTDFYRLHDAAHGLDWCRCVAWWVPAWDGWGERTADQNLRLREGLLADGIRDGYLLYVAEEPVAWCQVGPRDRLEKLRGEHGLAPDPEAWALSCLVVVPTHRGRGLARALVRGILEDLRRRGVRRVEAFPRRGVDLGASEVWTGPERLFQGLGFDLVGEGPRRRIYRTELG